MTMDIQLDGACVLVIDDEPANLLLLERLLAGVGVGRVCSTNDPREATALFTSERPDLVLLDLHMPVMDGIAVLDALATLIDRDDFVPIVILTADSTPPARERALASGASDFLLKPFERTEVLLRVRNLLHARTLHSRVLAHSVALREELDALRATADAAQRRESAISERVEAVLTAGGPRMIFQPVVGLHTGSVIAYEALARFDDQPVRPPDVWFAEAAEVGLGESLETAAAAAALRSLPELSAALPIAINVSPRAATSRRFRDLLADHPGDRVILEITEHEPVADYDELLHALDHFRGQGARIAVDDAGAGFAGLQHILRLRPEIIKLDIALTRDIDTEPAKRALGSALVAFAAEIGSTIIAEGIETDAERSTLQLLGVDAGQGYLLGRPAPLEDGRVRLT